MEDTAPLILHASAVAVEGRGLLITGASGSGKSSLALELISRGARLVADDRVSAEPLPEGALRLTPPDAIAGRIEARGVGLLALPHEIAHASAVVDLDETETDRLPERHEVVIAGVALPLLRAVESPAFPAMLLAYLHGGRAAP
ncbi:MAG: serine kinase [Paracoccaceae bacterium]|nr:serine kinase [Paracoccaceae bacterium]